MCVVNWIADYFDSPALVIIDNDSDRYVFDLLNYNHPYSFYHFSNIESNQLERHMLNWKASAITIFFLLCSLECNLKIINAASVTGLIDNDFVWLTSKGETIFITEMLPNNILYLDVRTSVSMFPWISCANYKDTNALRFVA